MRTTLLLASSLLLAGCFNFDQLAADCVSRGDCQGMVEAPQLVETSPANQATDVRTDVSLVLKFSKAMARDAVQLTLAPPVALAAGAWTDDDTTFTVQPQALLPAATSFSVSVAGRSADGAALASGTSFTFTTQAAPDTQAPALVSTSPVNNAMAVSPTTPVSLVFSEPMEPLSVQLSSVPSAAWGTPTWSADGKTALFTPEPLAEGTTYALVVDGADRAGNALAGVATFGFTTGTLPPPPDTTAPTVVATTPMQGASGVATSLAPTVFFSEPMKRAELLAATTVTPSAGIVLTTDDPLAPTQLTLTHAAPLPSGTLITVTIGTGAVDLAGNALAAPFTWTFTTGTAPDTTAPTIVAVSPADGGVGAVFQPVLQVDFSEPMDPAATQAAVVVSMPAGVTGTPSWSNNNTRLSWAVNQALPEWQVVRWQVGTGAKDLSGNALAQTQVFTFRVRKRTTVTLGTGQVLRSGTASRTLPGGRPQFSAMGMAVGDSASLLPISTTTALRAVIDFSLATLPATVLGIESARLRLTVASATGTPFLNGRWVGLQASNDAATQLGYEIVTTQLACPNRDCTLPFISTAAAVTIDRDVLDYVRPQVLRRDSRLNFRLVFATGSAGQVTFLEEVGTAGSDAITLTPPSSGGSSTTQPQLVLTVLEP